MDSSRGGSSWDAGWDDSQAGWWQGGQWNPDGTWNSWNEGSGNAGSSESSRGFGRGSGDGRGKGQAKKKAKAKSAQPKARPPVPGPEEEEEAGRSRREREAWRLSLREEMAELRRTVHTQDELLSSVPTLRAEYVQALEQRTEARTEFRLQQQMASGVANMLNTCKEEMKEVEASRSAEVRTLQAEEDAASASQAAQKRLQEELAAQELQVAEQIKRGRLWWEKAKKLEASEKVLSVECKLEVKSRESWQDSLICSGLVIACRDKKTLQEEMLQRAQGKFRSELRTQVGLHDCFAVSVAGCLGHASGGHDGVPVAPVQRVRGLIALQRSVYFLHQLCQERAIEKAMDFKSRQSGAVA